MKYKNFRYLPLAISLISIRVSAEEVQPQYISQDTVITIPQVNETVSLESVPEATNTYLPKEEVSSSQEEVTQENIFYRHLAKDELKTLEGSIDLVKEDFDSSTISDTDSAFLIYTDKEVKEEVVSIIEDSESDKTPLVENSETPSFFGRAVKVAGLVLPKTGDGKVSFGRTLLGLAILSLGVSILYRHRKETKAIAFSLGLIGLLFYGFNVNADLVEVNLVGIVKTLVESKELGKSYIKDYEYVGYYVVDEFTYLSATGQWVVDEIPQEVTPEVVQPVTPVEQVTQPTQDLSQTPQTVVDQSSVGTNYNQEYNQQYTQDYVQPTYTDQSYANPTVDPNTGYSQGTDYSTQNYTDYSNQTYAEQPAVDYSNQGW